MKTSSTFNQCKQNKEGKAYATQPTYASNPFALQLAKWKLQKDSASKEIHQSFYLQFDITRLEMLIQLKIPRTVAKTSNGKN